MPAMQGRIVLLFFIFRIGQTDLSFCHFASCVCGLLFPSLFFAFWYFPRVISSLRSNRLAKICPDQSWDNTTWSEAPLLAQFSVSLMTWNVLWWVSSSKRTDDTGTLSELSWKVTLDWATAQCSIWESQQGLGLWTDCNSHEELPSLIKGENCLSWDLDWWKWGRYTAEDDPSENIRSKTRIKHWPNRWQGGVARTRGERRRGLQIRLSSKRYLV